MKEAKAFKWYHHWYQGKFRFFFLFFFFFSFFFLFFSFFFFSYHSIPFFLPFSIPQNQFISILSVAKRIVLSMFLHGDPHKPLVQVMGILLGIVFVLLLPPLSIVKVVILISIKRSQVFFFFFSFLFFSFLSFPFLSFPFLPFPSLPFLSLPLPPLPSLPLPSPLKTLLPRIFYRLPQLLRLPF